jgi:hypothetical protein
MAAAKKKVRLKPPKLHPLQQKIADHPARFRVVVCGRRWGKTRLGAYLGLKTSVRAAAAQALPTVRRGGRVWWVAPVYFQARIAWRVLKPVVRRIPGVVIRESDKVFLFPGGGELWFKSADRPDGLRGEGLDGLIIDEADFIDGEVWSKTLRPALADRRGWALFISTPQTKDGWFHKLYKRGQKDGKVWASWSYPSWTNPFLDPEEIEEAKGDMTELEFAQEFGAEFVDKPDLVYYAFDEDTHVQPCPLAPGQPVYVGLDFNNSPRVALFIQRAGPVFRVVGELYHPTQATTDEHAMFCRAWLEARGWKVDPKAKAVPAAQVLAIADASGKSMMHSGKSDHQLFREGGFVLDVPLNNPPIRDRDNTVLAHFRNAKKEIRLLIDPSCKHLIQALQNLKHSGRDGSPWGHILDALGYVLHRLAPVQPPAGKPILPTPQRARPKPKGRALPRL